MCFAAADVQTCSLAKSQDLLNRINLGQFRPVPAGVSDLKRVAQQAQVWAVRGMISLASGGRWTGFNRVRSSVRHPQ